MSPKPAIKPKGDGMPLQLRWRNFRSFRDTGWFDILPLTIILGANNSGKTNLMRPLLLLKQTLDSGDDHIALKITGPLTDVGIYRNVVHGGKKTQTFEFGIRFHPPEEPKKNLRAVGYYPPGEVGLEFGVGRDPLEVTLRRFEVFDGYGRSCLSRKRNESGSYTLSTKLKIDRRIARITKSVLPRHFMFSGFGIFSRLFQERAQGKGGKQASRSKRLKLLIPGRSPDLLTLVTYVESHLNAILSSISYIGPLREYPKRFYESTEEIPDAVGVRGEFAPHILYLTKDADLVTKTNEWLRSFGLASRVTWDRFHDDLFALKFKDPNRTSAVDYSDSGFGLSQLLPVIVEGFHPKRRQILFLEQPEIHLNPGLQCKLANLFASFATAKKKVVVETHSEHLVLRVRALIAERKLRPEDVALYYVEKSGKSSSLRRIPITQDGHINPDLWPVGFFEESLSEALRLARSPRNMGALRAH
jgi:predicted ATPase